MDLRKIEQDGNRAFKAIQNFSAELPMDERTANTKYQAVYIRFENFEDSVKAAQQKIKQLEQLVRKVDTLRQKVERNF